MGRVSKHPISFGAIGAAYHTSRQRAFQLAADHGIDALLDPQELFTRLCDTGKASRIRVLLSSPTERAKVSATLAAFAKISVMVARADKATGTIKKLCNENHALRAEISAMRQMLPLPRCS